MTRATATGIPVTAMDVPTLRLAHRLLEKALVQAGAALSVLNLDFEELSELSLDATRCKALIDGNVGRDDWTFSPGLANPATLGLSILLAKIDKLKDAQMDLLLPVHETADKEAEVRELHDRIKGVPLTATLFEEDQ